MRKIYIDQNNNIHYVAMVTETLQRNVITTIRIEELYPEFGYHGVVYGKYYSDTLLSVQKNDFGRYDKLYEIKTDEIHDDCKIVEYPEYPDINKISEVLGVIGNIDVLGGYSKTVDKDFKADRYIEKLRDYDIFRELLDVLHNLNKQKNEDVL